MWYPFLCYLKQFSSVVPTNPFVSIFLRALCRRQKSQLLWNQANPDSFSKTPGVGVPQKSRLWNQQHPDSSSRLCLQVSYARASEVFLSAPVPPWQANLVPSVSTSASTPRPLRLCVILSLPSSFLSPLPAVAGLCFHNDTNPLSRNSLVFTFIQNPRGAPNFAIPGSVGDFANRLKSPHRFLAIRR